MPHYNKNILLLIITIEILNILIKVKAQDSSSIITGKYSSDTPDFTGPIKNVTVAIGREAILACSVTDLGHYKVGWLKADDQTILSLHTRVITHNPRISVTHDDSLRIWQLRIRQLKESDRGCYMCQINTEKMKKQLGCVDVQVPPDIDDSGTSSDLIVNEGDNVTLSCRAKGHPEPRILWRREDGNHIIILNKKNEIQKVDTFSGFVLNLAKVERTQMGAYFCIASNDVPPAVSKRVILSINFAPKIETSKSLVGVILYSSIKLKCEAEVFPITTSYWLREEDEILVHSLKYSFQEKKSGYKLIMNLIIHNISRYDLGTYSCIVNNLFGKSKATTKIYEIKITTTSTTTIPTTTTTPKKITTTTKATTRISTKKMPNRKKQIHLMEIAKPKSIEILHGKLLNTTLFSIASTKGIDDDMMMIVPESDPVENWLFPSMAPAPLEFEPHLNRGTQILVHFHTSLVLPLLLILR